MLARTQGNKITHILLWLHNMWQPFQKTVWQFLKLNVRPPHDPAVTVLGIYPRKMKLCSPKMKLCSPSVHKTALFVIAKKLQTTQMSFLGAWFNILSISQNHTQQKKWMTVIHTITWVDLKGIMLKGKRKKKKKQSPKTAFCMILVL